MYVVAKILVWVLTHCWFFLKKEGRENIPRRGRRYWCATTST